MRQSVPTSALDPLVQVTMPGEAETFMTVIDEITYGTDFTLVRLLHWENVNLTHKDLNTSTDEPENRWNIHLMSYDTSPSRVKSSSNGQLIYCSWGFGIFDVFHWYKKKNCVGWKITMKAIIGFNLQVTATRGFHSL